MRINLNELRQIIIEAMLNAYQVLGVPQNASDEEIKKAWRNLAIANHPDRGGSHGKMVDINNAKDRLLNKTNLFRYGPNFKGYEDANAPKPPEMVTCPHCKRNVAVKDNKVVGHYTEAGGSTKCEGSFKAPPPKASAGPKDRGGARSQGDYERDFWNDFFRRQQQRDQQPPPRDRSAYEPPPRPGPRPAPNPPPGANAPPGDPGTWRASRGRPGYEYNTRTGEYRRAGQQGAGGQAAGAAAGNHRYFTFVQGRSRKFWEVERVGATLYVRWGRIGSPGYAKPYTYANADRAASSMRNMAQGKLDKGYVEGTPPRGAARPSQHNGPGAAGPAPGAAAGGGQQPPNAPAGHQYKVYGWPQGRRVIRVKGQVYGTGPGGNLSGGGQTRFNSNDRLNVTRDGNRVKVKKDGGEHTQTWDPIDQVDEVKSLVAGLVLDVIQEIAESE